MKFRNDGKGYPDPGTFQGPLTPSPETDDQKCSPSLECERDAAHGQCQSAWIFTHLLSQIRKTPKRRRSKGGYWQTPPFLLEPGVAHTRAISLAQGSRLAGSLISPYLSGSATAKPCTPLFFASFRTVTTVSVCVQGVISCSGTPIDIGSEPWARNCWIVRWTSSAGYRRKFNDQTSGQARP